MIYRARQSSDLGNDICHHNITTPSPTCNKYVNYVEKQSPTTDRHRSTGLYCKPTIVLMQGSIPNCRQPAHTPTNSKQATQITPMLFHPSCASTTHDGYARLWLPASTARAIRTGITIDSDLNSVGKIAELGRHGTV
jgi:hypothetical protein